MNWFISEALADNGAAPAGGGLSMFVTFGLMIAVFYFLLIRPQQKRAKEHKALIDALAKGDEVVTVGGLLGRVTHVAESIITVEIADKVQIKVQRPAVQAILPKGTLKND